VKTRQVEDAYLWLHVAPTGDQGYDCQQLAAYYGVANRLVLVEPGAYKGASEEFLARTYACFDVGFTTTQGEGWGLTTMEAMACGIPQIVPDWSALGEWTEDTAVKVPCTSIAVTPNRINAIGGIADREAAIAALDQLYRSPERRRELGEAGRALVSRPCYRWPAIGARFAEAIDEALDLVKTGRTPAALEEA